VEGVSHFEKLWASEFSRFPGFDQLSPLLRKELLSNKKLSPVVRAYLEKGHDPLKLGNANLLEGLKAAYLKLIEASRLAAEKKEKLKQALEGAVNELQLDGLPPAGTGGTGGGDSGSGGSGSLPEEPSSAEFSGIIAKELNEEALKRCVVRTGILFFVSNLINTTGAIEAKWSVYAGEDGASIEKVFEKDTWERALSDPDFRHNITWNAILMLSLGALSCLSDKQLGKNVMGVISGVTSLAGQYLSTGKISLRQTVLDILFVRFISVNKTAFVFRLAESYSRRGLPLPHLTEALLQGLSEGFGAYLYPRTVQWVKIIWPD